MTRILDSLPDGFLGHALAIVAVVVLVPVALTAAPTLFGADRAAVAGPGADGMEPTLSDHHVVFVETQTAAIQRGDVVAYRGGDTMQYSRVTLVTSVDGAAAFVTSDDARRRPNEDPVPAPEVRGRVVLSMPYVGALVGPARSAPVLGAVVVPALGLAVYELLAWALLVGVVAVETDRLLASVESSLADSSGGGLALSRTDLTATTLALGAFAAFSVGVLLSAPSPVTLTLGILAVGLLGYAGVLWWSAPPSPPDGAGPSVVTGSLARTADGRVCVAVDSVEDLAGMARAADRPLAVDDDAGSSFLPYDDVVYVCNDVPEDVGS